MRRILTIASALGLSAVLLAGGARPAHAMTAGSFLKRPVPSLSVFLARVRTDPALQKRYGRHLGIDWRVIPDFLGHRLRGDTVRRPGYFTVYQVAGNGDIYPTKQRLAAGTRIFRISRSEVFFTVNGDPARPFFKPVVELPVPVPAAVPKAPGPPQDVDSLRTDVVIIHVPSE